MKRFLLFLLFSAILNVSLLTQINTPWKWSHPIPQGNTLRFVKVFSTTSWVGIGYAGTFIKTTNGGVNWYIRHDIAGTQTTDQLFFYNGWFFDANTGFGCGESGKLVRTTNGGSSWDSISTGVTGTLYGIHFINNSTGFIGGSSGTVLKTTNGGLNWTPLTTGITTTINNIFARDVNNIYAPTTSANLRVSTDGGVNWVTQLTGTSVTLYDVYFRDANTGIVCGSSTALRYTTNGGLNWTATNTGLPSSTLYSINYFPGLADTDYWYASGNSFYAFRSINNGLTWDSVSIAGTQTYVSTYYNLDRNVSTMVTAGAFGLINSSTNGGANWTAHNSLPYGSTLNDIWCENMNGRVIAVGSVSPTPLMYSSNGGASWSTDPGLPITSTLYGIKMINSLTGYVSGSSNRVYKTTNGGATWDSVSTAIGASTTLYCPDFVNVNTGWVSGSSGRVFKTTNGGANWSLLTTGITNTLYRIDMFDANTGWFIGSTGTVRKTTDGGTSWTAQTSNYGSTINWIQMINVNTGYLCGLSGNMRKTTNGGANWDTLATPVTNSLYSLSFADANTGLVSGSAGLTMRTTSGGASWEIFNSAGATMNGIYARHRDSAWVCGSSAGILKFTQGLVGTMNWSNEVPLTYTLEQNYPNPFNPSTTIKFSIPKISKVSLKLYDITGREVDILINNMELNAGTVTYTFDGLNFASGVYFYSLIADDNIISSKKMILVK
jgi:photosystem II stability/assembly factor-like uncharacterized protein